MKSEATPGREELPHSTIRLLALAEKLEGPQCLVSADDRAIAASACRLAAKPADEGVREAIIEGSESTNGHRMLTVRSEDGNEFIIDADAAAVALAELFSNVDNEKRQGWTLYAGWYAQEIKTLRSRALSTTTEPKRTREGVCPSCGGHGVVRVPVPGDPHMSIAERESHDNEGED